jgi:hypothetical protein
MSRLSRAREENESGVVLIIVALAMVVLLGMLAIAIDASYGFVQNRRAQNASDFAAFAAAQELNDSSYCNGTSQPTMERIVSIIQDVVHDNDTDAEDAWTAQFLDTESNPPTKLGNPFTFSDYATQVGTLPPAHACGVIVSTTPSWPTFFAGILGLHRLGGYASASVAPTAPVANGIGIVALNQAGPHEVLGGGTGKFIVSGTIFLNTNVLNQPWSGSSVSVTGSTDVGTSPAVVITSGTNDTVDVTDDGTPHTLTIAAGTYSGDSLRSAVQSAISAAGLCNCQLQAAYNYSGQLVLSTRDGTNTTTTLQVTGGDALGTLGLSVMAAPVTGYVFNDAIDAKADSNLYVYGTIDTNNGTVGSETMWPLDTCFEPEGAIASGTAQTLASGNPPGVQMSCTADGGSSVTVDYNAISTIFPQESDPLQAQGAPPNPFSQNADNNCPGMATVTNPAPTVSGTTTTMYPGVYTTPVDLTSTTVLDDCAGYNDSVDNNGQPEGAYPGIYVFQDGLDIDPAAGATVSGSDIVLATQAPDPISGNVPGSVTNGTFTASGPGNGAPCLPSGTLTDLQSGNGNQVPETVQPGPGVSPCGGTTDYGVVAFHDSGTSPDSSETGTGTNFSALVGGQGTVSLTGPTTGAYGGDGADGIVLYQDPNTPGNYGFDAEAGDSAGITINGVVYNASLANEGAGGTFDYWDGVGGGVVFYDGGTLQTGYGTDWSDGPTESSGSVQINGTAVVDDFNTDGTTDITIAGGSYTPPGGNHLQLIG